MKPRRSAKSRAAKKRAIAQQLPTESNQRRIDLLKKKTRPEQFEFLGKLKVKDLAGEVSQKRILLTKRIVDRANIPAALEEAYYHLPAELMLRDKRLRLWNTVYSRFLQSISNNPLAQAELSKQLKKRARIHVIYDAALQWEPISCKWTIEALRGLITGLRFQCVEIRKRKVDADEISYIELTKEERRLAREMETYRKSLEVMEFLSQKMIDFRLPFEHDVARRMLGFQGHLFSMLTKPQQHALWQIDQEAEDWIHRKRDVHYQLGH